MTDGELRIETGIEPHQQVNQICRRLVASGSITRSAGPDGLILNKVADQSAPTPPADHDETFRQNSTARPDSASRALVAPASVRGRLLVVPCSGRKAPGGQAPTGSSPSVLDLLPSPLATDLLAARAALAPLAGVDQRVVLPAIKRYAGRFYEAGAEGLRNAIASGQPLLILSGGYGLLLPEEAIGDYDREFKRGDWPSGLIEACLVAVAERLGCTGVSAFLASTTGYADVIRRTRWDSRALDAQLLSPVVGGGEGAQVLVPRALGEALSAAMLGGLDAGWSSSDGVSMQAIALGATA